MLRCRGGPAGGHRKTGIGVRPVRVPRRLVTRRFRRRHLRRRTYRAAQIHTRRCRCFPPAHPPRRAPWPRREEASALLPGVGAPRGYRASPASRTGGHPRPRPQWPGQEWRGENRHPAGARVHPLQARPVLRGQGAPAGRAADANVPRLRGVGVLPHERPPLRPHRPGDALGLQLRALEYAGGAGHGRGRAARRAVLPRQPRAGHLVRARPGCRARRRARAHRGR